MARYVITDIHGCARTFKALVLEQLRLRKEDELYLLGDYVNKGPDSKGVIDFILHLQKQHYQVHCLRGNHDQMLLHAVTSGDRALKLTPDERKLTLQSFRITDITHLPDKYVAFLSTLRYYMELPDYFLVHAGFDFKQVDIFKDTDAMMNIRDYKPDWTKLSDKRLLHGHTPTVLSTIQKGVAANLPCLNLDAGCAYYKNAGLGTLIALDLDRRQLHLQSNLDKPYPISIKD